MEEKKNFFYYILLQLPILQIFTLVFVSVNVNQCKTVYTRGNRVKRQLTVTVVQLPDFQDQPTHGSLGIKMLFL